ncbi:MAG: heparin lyase I family protein [Bacteroidales bacterium]
MKNLFFKLVLNTILILGAVNSSAQTILTADGPGNTYELINRVLAPGHDAIDTPDALDPAFGRHIAEVWDEDLKQFVFEFYLHVSVVNELQDVFETRIAGKQRIEIKSYKYSPENLQGVSGETVIYRWKFKLPKGFQTSSQWTHIHQVKASGGDEYNPLFALTCRKGNPNQLELNYCSNTISGFSKLRTINLAPFEGTWVEATERIKIDSIHGNYSIDIIKVSDGSKMLSYSNNDLPTYRANNSFIRPKWGIYRGIVKVSDLRDETIRFNSFSIAEE